MSEPIDAVGIAVRALRHRDRSAQELEERLARAGVDAVTRADALATLRRLGYVDDGRAAAGRAEALAARAYGDEAIRVDLERRGFDAHAIEAALAALQPEAERARTAVERDGATPRVARRLAAKGFAADVIAGVVRPDIAEGDAEAV